MRESVFTFPYVEIVIFIVFDESKVTFSIFGISFLIVLLNQVNIIIPYIGIMKIYNS